MRRLVAGVVAVGLLSAAIAMRGAQGDQALPPYVDGTGKISVPEDYRLWTFLGSWHIAAEKGVSDTAGAAGFHNVYARRSTVEHYRKTGTFPDGAILVKELLTVQSGRLTTGEATWATRIEGWFVMVKDTKGRFPGHPLWGNGWGWALFNADNPGRTVTTDWRTDCLGCHAPARSSDWVFTQGYPILQRDSR